MSRLKEVADKIGKHGYNSPPALQAIKNIPIHQVAVGPSHIALLLQVCTAVIDHVLCTNISCRIQLKQAQIQLLL